MLPNQERNAGPLSSSGETSETCEQYLARLTQVSLGVARSISSIARTGTIISDFYPQFDGLTNAAREALRHIRAWEIERQEAESAGVIEMPNLDDPVGAYRLQFREAVSHLSRLNTEVSGVAMACGSRGEVEIASDIDVRAFISFLHGIFPSEGINDGLCLNRIRGETSEEIQTAQRHMTFLVENLAPEQMPNLFHFFLENGISRLPILRVRLEKQVNRKQNLSLIGEIILLEERIRVIGSLELPAQQAALLDTLRDPTTRNDALAHPGELENLRRTLGPIYGRARLSLEVSLLLDEIARENGSNCFHSEENIDFLKDLGVQFSLVGDFCNGRNEMSLERIQILRNRLLEIRGEVKRRQETPEQRGNMITRLLAIEDHLGTSKFPRELLAFLGQVRFEPNSLSMEDLMTTYNLLRDFIADQGEDINTVEDKIKKSQRQHTDPPNLPDVNAHVNADADVNTDNKANTHLEATAVDCDLEAETAILQEGKVETTQQDHDHEPELSAEELEMLNKQQIALDLKLRQIANKATAQLMTQYLRLAPMRLSPVELGLAGIRICEKLFTLLKNEGSFEVLFHKITLLSRDKQVEYIERYLIGEMDEEAMFDFSWMLEEDLAQEAEVRTALIKKASKNAPKKRR